MTKPGFNILFCLALYFFYGLPGFAQLNSAYNISPLVYEDTLDRQMLYNGRVWRNLYTRVNGDQFLFTKEFLPGSVTIGNQVFRNLKIRYDILNDEIMLISDRGMILRLNNELVNGFTINHNDTINQFRRIDPDSVNSLSGYVQVLYDGKSSLYLKQRKEILLLEIDHKVDKFEESSRIYLEKEGKIYLINSKWDLLNTLKEFKPQIRNFIRSNRLYVSKQDPWSFIPVIEYYDKLRK